MTSDRHDSQGSRTSRARQGSVLVVDDDRLTLKMIEKVLRIEGYAVTCTESERAAKTFFKENPADVVVTDLFMAGKSGLDLLRYLKELQPGIPVVILTSGSELKTVTEALRAGAFDYLQKPFQSPELVRLISRAMNCSVPTIAKNRTVMVVEDEVVTLGIVRTTLSDAGFVVLTCQTEEEAETLFAEGDVDVVVTDIGLPGKSGVDLLRFCQNRRPEVPVLIMTVTSDVRLAIECLRGGAFDFLLKPFQDEVLLGRVVRAYERKSLTDSNRRLERERALYEEKLEQLGRTLEDQIEARTRELSRVQRLSENILKSIPMGLVVTDNEGRISTANPAAGAILGLRADETTGRRIEEVVGLAPFAQAVRTAIDSGEPRLRAEVTIPTGGAERRLIEYTLSPLLGSGLGEPIGAVLHLTDATEKRAFESAVIQSNKMAAIGQMAAVMAHEVNSRLTIIVGFADLLRAKANEDRTVRDQADKILQAATQCESFVESMLRYSRPETQVMSEVDLHETLRSVVKLFEEEFRQRHVQLRTVFDSRVPTVWGIANELRQVFFNLFLNARDAMGQGGTLTVTTRLELDEVKVSVRDTGCGIDPAHVDEVFVPFFTTKGPGKGTGLGLAICATIVLRHRGKIGVESSPGTGATFTVRLPVEKPTTPISNSRSVTTKDVEASRRIVVIDDDPLILELCQTCLDRMGFVAVTCRTAEEALDKLESQDVAMAIVDVCLPKMDGLQFSRRLRQLGATTPIVIISGAPHLDGIDLKRTFQVDLLLKKPFTQADIREVVNTLLPGHDL